MKTAELFSALRFKLEREKFSDYQLVESLNYVLGEVGKALNSVTSSLTQSKVVLTLVDNEAVLPADLETIISVDGKVNVPMTETLSAATYQIVGNVIRCQGETVTIYYRKSFPYYTVDGFSVMPATIDLPVSFDNMIKDSIVNLLTGQPATIQADTIRLIAGRDGKKRSQRLIFTM